MAKLHVGLGGVEHVYAFPAAAKKYKNCMSGLMGVGHVGSLKKVKLHVEFDGN